VDYISKLQEIFTQAVKLNATDLHLAVGEPPIFRVDGALKKQDGEKLDQIAVENLAISTLRAEYLDRLRREKEIDFSFSFGNARVRSNVYFEKGSIAEAFRFIPQKIRLIRELGLPPVIERFAKVSHGLVLMTGPTGSGKSTTMAAIIETINQTYAKHIITIEDPMEYVFEDKKSFISQREYGTDTLSFGRALRSALREDPDVVMIGEMRDLTTIEAALTIAETGHLVLATLHTNSAAQTADRIIDIFPEHQQEQVRQQLANELSAIISQRLVPKVSGGRISVCEILISNPAIASLIRENKTHQIQNIISTSASEGMITLDKVLADLVSRGDISFEEALKWTGDVKEFKQMVY